MNMEFKLQIASAVLAKSRKYVTSFDVAAICCHESDCVPAFELTDTLYKANLQAACSITSLTADVITQAATIKSGPL